ncbi:TPA: pyruvate:ferredoxin (flavodoxin) oxidoreductase [Escherichia coli]|nr:pyruvate:ferredoxin (flavodoxin) oxidoreductase [Escherichia coli]
MITIDGNGAVASVAFRTSEVIAIYPITPSSTMAEQADAWAGNGLKNVWGDTPRVVEMQSEAGAIATVHGALQTGALSTSFTSSQGLLLMIPTLYKLAGELTPFVLHVAARTVATHALSIFGDHSDVMAVRQTGCAMLCAANVQEAQDFALISQIATLKSRVPFIHFFDGFRTSHEINKIVPLADDTILDLMPQVEIDAHRARALNPEHPVIRGTSANPDTYFQSREATNPWYNAVYDHVEQAMNDFSAATGRQYQPFEYYGHPQAERVIILMGSAIGTCEEVVDELLTRGEKVGVLKVRLYRPFSAKHLLQALPGSVRSVAVLDRTKEPGAQAEPLYLDVMTALAEAFNNGERETLPRVIGGRYGLSSKEFGPDCVLAVFAELNAAKPKARFTVGIYDDVTNLSLPLPENTLPNSAKLEALFYGLGSDGSVSATKNNIKIIGNSTPWYAQGYFVYDSKKAGGLTVSHLRVSEQPIRSAYLISQADFVGCHQLQFIDKYQMAERLKPGGIFLLNTPYSADEVWSRLPQEVQAVLNQKKARFYVINAAKIARECGLAARINTVMQMAFFHLTQILPGDSALAELQGAIAKSYSSKGQDLVERNWQALALARESVEEVPLQPVNPHSANRPPVVSDAAPDFVKTVTAAMLAGLGDALPVSALPPDGTWPMGTTRWEKRNIAEEIPIWKEELCSKNQSWTRLAFAGLKFADYGSFDYGRNYGVMYDIEGWTDMLPEFGGDSYTNADNFMTGRANGVATYRNTDFFGLVNGLNFAVQYQGNNEGASNGQEGTNNGRDVRHENGDGWGLSTTYDLGMGFSAGAAYTSSDRTNDQVNHTAAGGDKADAWTAGLKYDANNIYLATMYSETRNMTPFGDSDYAVANKTQNFEVTAQYQFDFGLRPAVSFLMSKGRDLHAAGGADNPAGVDDKDLVKYADIGATYYFNKNMSTYVDYKINLLDEDDSFYAANGISTDDIVALGLVYQF